jgi:hypothetical protein
LQLGWTEQRSINLIQTNVLFLSAINYIAPKFFQPRNWRRGFAGDGEDCRGAAERFWRVGQGRLINHRGHRGAQGHLSRSRVSIRERDCAKSSACVSPGASSALEISDCGRCGSSKRSFGCKCVPEWKFGNEEKHGAIGDRDCFVGLSLLAMTVSGSFAVAERRLIVARRFNGGFRVWPSGSVAERRLRRVLSSAVPPGLKRCQ